MIKKWFLGNHDDNILWRLMRDNLRPQAFNYGIAMVAMVVIAVTTSATAWIMKDIIDSMVASGDRMRVYLVAASVAAIFTVKGIASYCQVVFLSRAGNSIIATQQRKIYDRILRHGVAFFKGQGSSDLLMRVTVSAQSARTVIDIIVVSFVRDLLTLIGLVAVMFYQQPVLSLASLTFGPIAVYGLRKIVQRVRRIMEQELLSVAEIIKVVQETSIGIRVIKAFALEERMTARMDKAVSQVEHRSNSLSKLEAATSPLMETLSGFAIAGVVALSGANLFASGVTTPGQLVSFVTALLMAYEPAKRLARMRVNIEAGLIGVNMMFQILDEPLTLTEAPEATPLPEGPGEVQFKDVSFHYLDGQPVISDMSLTFKAGETTALVGPSGGGKSTIINLIMRLYDPSSGEVLIDGAPVKGATFASLRDKISFVGQDTFLFSGTVMHNIGLGLPEATEEQIIAAAKAANAHEFIEKMAKGYHTDVGENGGNLSGGQRQRLAIARAILRDSEILLLDEATSSLDSQSEALVQEALERLSAGRTTIVIAHRLSTVLGAEKIVVIEGGRVVEEGPSSELLQKEGLFRQLFDYQFGGRTSDVKLV
jgi:subfamily B ATP-binding cassette protein MsbA